MTETLPINIGAEGISKSLITTTPSGFKYSSHLIVSMISKETNISASPIPIIGEDTSLPYLTWVETLPPLWAIPWISDIFTS
jgi:hypothetical protein